MSIDKKLMLYAIGEIDNNLFIQGDPLFIQGIKDTEKTETIKIILDRIKEVSPDSIILHVTANGYIKKYCKSLGEDKKIQFNNYIRDYVDVLIIEDIETLSHKFKLQESFVNTLISRCENKKPTIFISSKNKDDIEGFDDALFSRLFMGLVV